MDITKIMDVVNRSAVARQDTSKTSVAARSQQRMQYSVRIIIAFLFATFAQFAAIFLVSLTGKMAAVDTVLGQFEDAVEDQLLITLNGKKTNRCNAGDNFDDLREDEGQYSFSDGDSSEEEGGFVAWEWEGRASDLTKKYNAARLVGVELNLAPLELACQSQSLT